MKKPARNASFFRIKQDMKNYIANKKTNNAKKHSEAGGNEQKDTSWSALGLAWELGYTIAIPIVVFALLGRFLDKKMGTSPWLLLGGIFLSIIVSSFMVYKKTVDIMNRK